MSISPDNESLRASHDLSNEELCKNIVDRCVATDGNTAPNLNPHASRYVSAVPPRDCEGISDLYFDGQRWYDLSRASRETVEAAHNLRSGAVAVPKDAILLYNQSERQD